MKIKPQTKVSILKIIFIQISLILFCNLMYSISFQFLSGYAVVSDQLPENFVHLPMEEQQSIQKGLAKQLITDMSQSPMELQKKYFQVILKKPIFLFIGSLFWAFFYLYTAYMLFSKFLKVRFFSLEDNFSGQIAFLGITTGIIVLAFMLISSKTLLYYGFKVEPSIFQKLLIKNLQGNKDLFLWSLYSVGVITGIIEELFFRGFLLKHFKEFGFPVFGVIFTSFVFGFMHYNAEVSLFVPLLLSIVGLYFGYLYAYTNNIWLPIIGHVSYNSLIVTIAYSTGDRFL